MSDDLDLSTEVKEVTPESIEPAEKTMDDTIRETLDAINSRDEETQVDRTRDEKGRFAKTEAAIEPVVADTPLQAEPAPVSVPPELQRLGLRKDEAEAFSKADETVRNAFIRRSEEMHRGIEQFRSKAELGHAIEQVMQPFAGNLQAMGIHPAQAFQRLMVADHSLRHGTPQQKSQMLLKIASDYGIDLGQAQQYQMEQPQADPQVSALQTQLQQMQAWILQRNQQEQAREQASLHSEIAQFSSDPANKHFEAVRAQMAGLLQSGMAQNLKEAYEQAIYANPQIRALVLAEQQAEASKKTEQAQKAQDAKRAASINVARKGSLPSRKPVGSMEDTIRAEAERLGLM